MRADAGLKADPRYPSVLAQEFVSCTIIALFMQRSITAARGEIDAAEAAGNVEEKRRLNAELLAVREQLEQAQFDLALVRQRLSAAESGREVREFETRIFVRI